MMKKISFSILLGVVLVLSAFTIYNSIDWKIKDEFSIKFKCKEVKGEFKNFTGNISFDENDLENSKFSTSIEVSSAETGSGIKDKHTKGDKWLNAKKFPKITFNSSKFSKTANGYQVKGTLELHGVKKQITIPFTFSSNTFKGNFTVNRMDYGIGTMDGVANLVPNEVKIEFSVPVTKK
ncbi:MAG: YceI family protein [Bacteroidota bacterium]